MKQHSLFEVMMIILVSSSLGILYGCSSDTNEGKEDHNPSNEYLLSSKDGIALKFHPDSEEFLTLETKEKRLSSLVRSSFILGIVPQVQDKTNYDPYPLITKDETYQPPEGLEWIEPSTIELSSSTDGNLSFLLTYPNAISCLLNITMPSDGTFQLQLVPQDGKEKIAYFKLGLHISETDRIYGLGEYFDSADNRGKIRAMQIEAMAQIESNYNEAHVPIPLAIGSSGWGMFVNSPYPGVFEVATNANDLIEATFGPGVYSKDGIEFYLFGEEHPLDVLKHYYQITGFPKLPAPWALGPWLWRDENRDQRQIEEDLDTIRDLDLAVSGYWIDRPYATCVNSFDFDETMFSNPQAMIKKAHQLGIRMAVWHTPYVDKQCNKSQVLHNQAEENGYYPPKTGMLLNHWGKPIDFTNQDAYSWWQQLLQNYTSIGIEGYKLDYAEDVIPGILGVRNVWKFADGSDERTMHARYQYFYHKVYSETLPEDGGFMLCRGGTYGDQVNGCIIWPGDLDADFSRHMEEREDGKLAVGGLPASMIAGISLSASGFPFYGADTGGYRHSPPDKECLTRWFEQTALSTVMQIGNSASNMPWEFDDDTGYDEEMLNWFRKYTRLHMRLFPYEWTYAKQIERTGHPIQRPLGMAYPQMQQEVDDEYLFGEYLLVAPVLERGATERKVIFPPGEWVEFWSATWFDGDAEATVDAPLGKLPLFVAKGAIVPMLRPTIDTIAPASDPAIESFANDAGKLYVTIVAGEVSSFTLFDGTNISQEDSSSGIKVSYEAGSVFDKGAILQIRSKNFDTNTKFSVLLNGTEIYECDDTSEEEPDGCYRFYEPTAELRIGSTASRFETEISY